MRVPTLFFRSFSTSRSYLKMPSSTLPQTEPPLKIYTTISSLRSSRRSSPSEHTHGFVPTMGALHEGHLSLIRAAAQQTDSITVSIFVNPAQFSPTEDLSTYPRTLPSDLSLLHSLNREFASSNARGRIQSLFLPTVPEMYPSGLASHESEQKGAFVTVQPLAQKLEGITRPHFFRGVATVCTKLFNITQPDIAYFGQKDVQQCVILKRLVKDLHIPTRIEVCSTGREEDGLAMSSRNVYLGAERRSQAPVVYRALRRAERVYREMVDTEAARSGRVDAGVVKAAGLEVINKAKQEGVKCELEYFSLADVEELEEVEKVDVTKGAIMSVALRMLPRHEGEGPVRLIDNVILEGRGNPPAR